MGILKNFYHAFIISARLLTIDNGCWEKKKNVDEDACGAQLVVVVVVAVASLQCTAAVRVGTRVCLFLPRVGRGRERDLMGWDGIVVFVNESSIYHPSGYLSDVLYRTRRVPSGARRRMSFSRVQQGWFLRSVSSFETIHLADEGQGKNKRSVGGGSSSCVSRDDGSSTRSPMITHLHHRALYRRTEEEDRGAAQDEGAACGAAGDR